MASLEATLVIIQIIFLFIMVDLCVLYMLPIIFVPRFQTAHNILTANFCATTIVGSLCWIIFDVYYGFFPQNLLQNEFLCALIPALQATISCLSIYALVMITVNRFCTIVYPQKPLFKKISWSFVSSVAQWFIAVAINLPNLAFWSPVGCMNYDLPDLWLRLYNVIVVVLLPIIVNTIFNVCILWSVRSSARRVHTIPASPATAAAANIQSQYSRDKRLLKHILFLFIVFIVGWAPVYVLTAMSENDKDLGTINYVFLILPAISTLIAVVDLLWYNHDIRKYLKEKLFKCLHLSRN